jgi:aminoglycoside/choline kinase family phosphotransferase
LRWSPQDSVVVVHYQPSRIENTYYAGIATFLLENNIPVPQIIRHDPAGCLILMKDLGDTDLWSLKNTSWDRRRNLYQKTLAIAHRLHFYPEKLFPTSRIKLMEAFGSDLYRWERDYFRDNFVRGFCEITLQPNFERQLEEELALLAKRLSSCRRSLVHRDLQSQNVMIYGEEPFLIDFQGMRFGSRFYDLGSLLCDPYATFSEGEREELLSFYFGLSKPESDWDSFRKMFWEASAQRLMQALGAYCSLGLHRGLKNYLVHIPAGLRNLRMAAENSNSLPRLLELCAECDKILVGREFQIGDR